MCEAVFAFQVTSGNVILSCHSHSPKQVEGKEEEGQVGKEGREEVLGERGLVAAGEDREGGWSCLEGVWVARFGARCTAAGAAVMVGEGQAGRAVQGKGWGAEVKVAEVWVVVETGVWAVVGRGRRVPAVQHM